MISYGFIITSLIVVLIPGTGVIYTVSTGLMSSRKDSIFAALGCTAGIIPHLTAGIAGLSAILHMSAVVFRTIKIVGVLYLLYLGWTMWRQKGGFKFDDSTAKKNCFEIITKAILINLLNPKLTLFFFAFLPQFITDGTVTYINQMIMLGSVFMFLTFIIFALYGIAANYFKRFIINSPKLARRIQQSFSIIFVGLAVKLALSER